MFSQNYHCCVTIFFLRRHNTDVCPDPVIHHRPKDKTTEVQLEWVSLVFLTGIWVRNYLQEQKWLKDDASPRPTPAWVTAHKSGNLEHKAQPTESSKGWRVSIPSNSSRQIGWLLPGSWSPLRIFLAAPLHVVWEELPAFIALLWLGRPSESD